MDDYSAMVRSLVGRFYSGVSRYTTSGLLRIKLGEALEKRGGAPHLFERGNEAQSDRRLAEGSWQCAAGPEVMQVRKSGTPAVRFNCNILSVVQIAVAERHFNQEGPSCVDHSP